MNTTKTSMNRTGVMFYDKLQNSKAYRVRFKSFNLSVYDDHNRSNEINALYKNYVLFKQGKCVFRPRLNSTLQGRKIREQQKYKANKQRVRQNESLRNRLKSMKNQRKTLLEKIKFSNNSIPIMKMDRDFMLTNYLKY